MPHISRQKLEKKVVEKIYTQLVKHLATSGGLKNKEALYSELLTETEQIMLSKRLAILCMLAEGYSFETIQEILKVSPSTVGRIWSQMQNKTFSKTLYFLEKNKLSNKILEPLSAILDFVQSEHTPRWKFLEDL